MINRCGKAKCLNGFDISINIPEFTILIWWAGESLIHFSDDYNGGDQWAVVA
jgi:hypothetical protein